MWSDVVCPWCYIGKRRFDDAVEQLRGDVEVDITYAAYQLDPTAPTDQPTAVIDAYARKFGGLERAQQIIDQVTATAAQSGLEFRMDVALRANTLLAHRLLWLAQATGTQQSLEERLFKAYFVDGLDVGDRNVLADCAADVGMARPAVAAFLDSDDGTEEVHRQLQFAAEHGITAVPTYVLNGSWSIPGAQDTETFVRVLRRIAQQS